MSVMPPSPLSYTGEVSVPYITKTFPPLSTNNRFSVPTLWVDTQAEEFYMLAANKYILGVLTAEWVKLGDTSGTVEGVIVDAHTAPGTSPVLPNSSLNPQVITITGGQVAAGTTSNVIQSNSLAANTLTIQIQRASAQAISTVGANGVSHFDSAHFTVGSNGFVSLIGGGAAVDSFTPDTGTSPVVPNGSGIVSVRGQVTPNISGIQVTGGTNVLNIAMLSPFVGDFSFLSNTGGGTRKLLVSNTVDAASSAAQIVVSVAGASSGDPSFIWSTTATDWTAGIDNSDSDSWKISNSSTLGTNDILTITTSGVSATFFVSNLSSQHSDAGGLTQLGIQNTSSAASSSTRLTITSQDTAGDSYILFDPHAGVNPKNRFILGETQADVFQLNVVTTTGTTLMSGTSVIIVTTAGSITKPKQPAFAAYLGTSTADNVTGDGTVYTVICNIENVDQQSNYDSTTGTFTCPTTGLYLYTWYVTLENLGALHTSGYNHVSGTVDIRGTLLNVGAVRDSGNFCTLSVSALVFTTVGNTVNSKVTVSGGTKTVGITGGTDGDGAPYTYFTAALIC